MVDKSLLSMPSIGSSSAELKKSLASPKQKDTKVGADGKLAEKSAQHVTVIDESSESENEAEPARVFQRRVSTNKTLNGSVNSFRSIIVLNLAPKTCPPPSISVSQHLIPFKKTQHIVVIRAVDFINKLWIHFFRIKKEQ